VAGESEAQALASRAEFADAAARRPMLSRFGDRSGLSVVDPDLVTMLRQGLRAQTAECVMATFGVSIVTWSKIRDGKPIRTSVAQRLVERLKLER